MSELATDFLLDDKYKIVRLVGQGGWATVYEAINLRIQRRVAIKVLNADLADKPELAVRFKREAEAATQIESPFVVTMFDAGTLTDGRPYIVMEFLEGESLGTRIQRLGAISEEETAGYAIHLLSGLADAHDTGILHRDIKPDNLVIVKTKHGEEILKLVDFGISKPNVARPEMLQMTSNDLVLGSPVYMSPEQARGTRHMDHRSDLFSVGVVLYEALTRELPHSAESFNELMFKVALEDVPDPRTKRPDLDEEMCKIVLKALEREPDKRFQSASQFRDVLTAWLENRGAPQPPRAYVTSRFRVRSGTGEAAAPTLPAPALTESGIERKPVVPEAFAQTQASVEQASVAQASAEPAPARPKKQPVAILIGSLILLGGAIIFSVTRARTSDHPPSASVSPPTTSVPSSVHTPEVATPTVTATAANTAPPEATTTSPAIAPAPLPAGKAAGPLPHSGGGNTKRTTPSASVSVSVPPPAVVSAAPPAKPAASSTVVEGRTVRTNF